MHHLVATLGGNKYYICAALELEQLRSISVLWAHFYPEASFAQIDRHLGRLEFAQYQDNLKFVTDYKRNYFLNEVIGG